MRKFLVVIVALFSMKVAVAQNAINAQPVAKTKYEIFMSDVGKMMKIYDVELPVLGTVSMSRNAYSTHIRVLTISNVDTYYFYKIGETLIAYEDLLEINRALLKLGKEIDNDASERPLYMENKFVTVDGFEVGYYIEKKKVQWFVDSPQISIVTFNKDDVSDLLNAFAEAQKKIEELMIGNK